MAHNPETEINRVPDKSKGKNPEGFSICDFKQLGFPALTSLSDELTHNLLIVDAKKESHASVHSITINGTNGARDIVSGIKARDGESVADLLKRLHPDLSKEQLAREVKHLLKYNKDYGNDLGDGLSLSSTKDILLPSVKYLDSQGRITKIEGPTGRVTEFSYDAIGQLSSYKISSADGNIEEQSRKDAFGDWMLIKHGRSEKIKSVEVDSHGNIIATDQKGTQFAHLTNGTDLRTTYDKNRPVEAVATIKGTQVGRFTYVYDGDSAKIFAVYPDNLSHKILLCESQTPEAMARLAIARGQSDIIDPSGTIYTGDLSASAFVRKNLVRSARKLLGESVTRFDASVPTNVGCARMVSQVLKTAGFDNGVIDTNVDNLEAKMKQRGFVAVKESQLQPGDIVIGVGPGPMDGHIGVYGGNGNVLHNSSSRGVFSEAPYTDVFGGFPRRVAYRYVGNA